MTISAATLSLFPASSTDVTTSLLSALHGSSSTTGTSAGNPILALQTAVKNETKQVAAVAKQPDTARDIAAFKTAVANAKTPADLLNNPTALKVLLTANGLASQAQYPALAKKALLSDTSKTGSLASTLTNTQWLAAAKTYDFANKGLKVLQDPTTISTITDGYAEVQWRTSLDNTTPGLSNALDFRSRASTITSVDQILGDPTFRDVVTTALGIPQQIAYQQLEAQEKAVSTAVDITKFKSPAFVEQFTKRYLVAKQMAAAASTTSNTTSTTASLFA